MSRSVFSWGNAKDNSVTVVSYENVERFGKLVVRVAEPSLYKFSFIVVRFGAWELL
jgi:hypothetical protein